jgi:hypothetical protein
MQNVKWRPQRVQAHAAAHKDTSHPKEIPMNRIRRCLSALAGRGRGLLALAATAPAAVASFPLPPGNPNPTPHAAIHPAATGGMPGWQITLIAAAAALVAAVTAVLLDRARTGRRLAHPAT